MTGTCGGHPFKLGKGGHKACDGLEMEVAMSVADISSSRQQSRINIRLTRWTWRAPPLPSAAGP